MIKEAISLPRHGLQLDDADGQCASYLKQVNGRAQKYAYHSGDLVRVAVAFVVGTRVWRRSWSDEEIWQRLDRWQRLAVFDHGVHPEFRAIAVDDTLGD